MVPSPKSHVYLTIVPSESEEPDASNVTLAPGATGVALAANDAVGQSNGRTESTADAVAVNPSESVTVRTIE